MTKWQTEGIYAGQNVAGKGQLLEPGAIEESGRSDPHSKAVTDRRPSQLGLTGYMTKVYRLPRWEGLPRDCLDSAMGPWIGHFPVVFALLHL